MPCPVLPPLPPSVTVRRTVTVGDISAATALVCVPARDEADELPAALAAIAAAARAAPEVTGLVLVLNNTTDASLPFAEAALAASGLPALVLDCVIAAPAAHVGTARRLALDTGANQPVARILLSTDADTHPAPNWITRAAERLARADLVCGEVTIRPAEAATLPAQVHACGAAEAAYRRRLDAVWRAVTGHGARGFTNRGSGANMAMRASAYRAVGGLPPLPSNEDRALHAAFEAAGLVICHDEGLRAATSARIAGRAPSGMGACLAARAAARDPAIDDQLPPFAAFLALIEARATGRDAPRWVPLRLSQVPAQMTAAQRWLARRATAAPADTARVA